MPPGVFVYVCPDGVNRSLYSDRRDCPGYASGANVAVDVGAGGGARSRFLGARGRFVPLSELAPTLGPTPEVPALNRNRILMLGIAGFSIALLLIFLARRRKKQ